MRQYLPLFLLMGLLAVASVSSTEYLYAQGDNGYLVAEEGQDVISVYKTYDLKDVKFSVKKFTRCHEIDFHSEGFLAESKIVIDEGPHKGKAGWVDFWQVAEN
jgi:hypothetical protein